MKTFKLFLVISLICVTYITQAQDVINFMERKGNKLTLNGRILSDNEVYALVGEENFKTYMSAKSQIDSGRASTIMFLLSVGTAICLATDAYFNYSPEKMLPVYVFAGLADVSLVFTCVLGGTGKGRMNWVADEYNRNNRGYSYSYSLSPSIMASKTPQLQNTYGLGLTFSMNF